MMSKMIGKRFGAAKNALPVATVINPPGSATAETFLDGLRLILLHIVTNRHQGKAVVNMSLNWKPINVGQEWRNSFAFLLQQLVLNGVSIVTGAGNTGEPLDGWPALFAEPQGSTPLVSELLVVGAVDTLGFRYIASQTGQSVLVYAPGAPGTWCANFRGGNKQSSGTSICKHAKPPTLKPRDP